MTWVGPNISVISAKYDSIKEVCEEVDSAQKRRESYTRRIHRHQEGKLPISHPLTAPLAETFFEIARERNRAIRSLVKSFLDEAYSGSREAVSRVSECLANVVILYMQAVSDPTIWPFYQRWDGGKQSHPGYPALLARFPKFSLFYAAKDMLKLLEDSLGFDEAVCEQIVFLYCAEKPFSQILQATLETLIDRKNGDAYPPVELSYEERDMLQAVSRDRGIRRAFLVKYASCYTLWAPLLNPLGAVMSLLWTSPSISDEQIRSAFHSGYLVHTERLRNREESISNEVVTAMCRLHTCTGTQMDGFFDSYTIRHRSGMRYWS
ncbi:uncharacterized protein BDV17DRAFT_288961 [Aspergillus undulatus]|uniref:uncharacterized protein n=1 Tax=Aspergillus undulatus TaxID=1810928 RepID=UPI003CCD37A8